MPIGIEKPSLTYCRKVGCGNLFIIFIEHHNGNFHKLLLRGDMSKETPCGESWFWGLARILTFAIRRALSEGEDALEQALVKHMMNQRCNMCFVGTDLSCMDAIAKAVREYIKSKRKEKKDG